MSRFKYLILSTIFGKTAAFWPWTFSFTEDIYLLRPIHDHKPEISITAKMLNEIANGYCYHLPAQLVLLWSIINFFPDLLFTKRYRITGHLINFL